jgi:hypothetical protein
VHDALLVGGVLKPIPKIDLATADVDKLTMTELKRVLNENNLKCTGCTEKSDYIKLVKEKLVPKKTEL